MGQGGILVAAAAGVAVLAGLAALASAAEPSAGTGLPASSSPAGERPGPASQAAGPGVPIVSRTTRAVSAHRWPTAAPGEVLRRFAAPPQRWAAGHRGVDLVAGAGAPVHASAAGVVVFAGWVVDRPVVSVQHADGLRTTYEPVEAVVVPGVGVDRGALLGHTVPGGHCSRPCLHWGARRASDDYVDPLGLLTVEVVRLLPLADAAPPA